MFAAALSSDRLDGAESLEVRFSSFLCFWNSGLSLAIEELGCWVGLWVFRSHRDAGWAIDSVSRGARTRGGFAHASGRAIVMRGRTWRVLMRSSDFVRGRPVEAGRSVV